MGRHGHDEHRITFAPWVKAAAAAVLALALAIIGYIVVTGRSQPVAGICSTATSLSIAAGPSAAPALSAAAAAYNETNPVARSSCISSSVTAVPDTAAIDGLADLWRTRHGPVPGLWIPDNAASLSALDAINPAVAAGHSKDPVAWSPTVLAVRTPDAPDISTIRWSDLPEAAGADGSAALTDGRHLMLDLPPVLENVATGYALQSVIAGRDADAAIDVDAVTTHRAVLTDLDDHGLHSDSTRTALTALAANDGEATAVPVVEADLVRFLGSDTTLTAVHPPGPTVAHALIPAPLTAPWTNRTTSAAASDFIAFLAGEQGQQILADHGWRTVSATPTEPAPTVDMSAAVTILPAGGPRVEQQLAITLGQLTPPPETSAPPPPTTTSPSPTGTSPTTTAPPSPAPGTTEPPTTTETPPVEMNDEGPVTVLIVDTSDGMLAEVDGHTLLEWTQQALLDISDGSVTDRMGLWIYSDARSLPPSGWPQLVTTGPLAEEIDGQPRIDRLREAIEDLPAGGERWGYGALIEALEGVPDAAVDGRDMRVVLLTTGEDETPGTPRNMVLDAERSVAGIASIDVVGLGDAVPAEAFSHIAQIGGGRYFPVADPADLGETLRDMLTLLN